MDTKITVVINTLNEEKNIPRAIKSVSWADEVIVCDMYSEDDTVKIARKLGAKIFFHKKTGYVEPARNFAISKASNDWVLVLDADEEIGLELGARLQEMAQKPIASDFVRLPRKNILFGKWMRATMWWPDYNIRFFKKGAVEWSDKIHVPPKTHGQGLDLPEEEKWAIIHYHYETIGQFIVRMNRYTDIQAQELVRSGYKFRWEDLINKSLGEFLSRYFANKGFEDGLHGLTLSLLQSFSFITVYLKVWEKEKFEQEEIQIKQLESTVDQAGEHLAYWFKHSGLSNNPFKRFFQKIKNKI